MNEYHIWRRSAFCFILALSLAITACGNAEVNADSAEPRPFKLLFATDLHFYAPELVGDFERFSHALAYGDGKVTHYSSELVQTLIDTALREKPDALLLGGDLSFNGEYESHRELSDMLKTVSDAGIPVLVVPGNHDINQLSAFRYADGDSCATIDEKGFSKLYGALGMNNAASKDKDSLTYLYALSGDVYLLMIDSCEYDGGGRSTGSVSDKTMKWIENQLKTAQKEGATVISVSHHNLLQHNPLWKEPFIIHDRAALVNLLERYGVKLNLTGHIHPQNILRAETASGLSEAATGAMSVNPHYYGMIEVGTDKSITYTAKSLDVSAWAKNVGKQDANLLDFANYSQVFFDSTTSNKMTKAFETSHASETELAQMIDFNVLVNRHYFAGTHDTIQATLHQHPGYALWTEKFKQRFFSTYIESVINDPATEHCYLRID